MLKEHNINKLNNFISGYYTDKKVCDNLITYFEKSNNKKDGVLLSAYGKYVVNKDKKASTDLGCRVTDNNKDIQNYLSQLNLALEAYKKQYPYCDKQQDKWAICEDFNIQKYKPSESYSQWHCEMSGIPSIYRHLTFMTYLNDVKKGGETEWFHQKLKIKPEKGLTVIWGTNWQTIHRGVPALKETKYIATGWYGYIPYTVN
tara:strand:+ start:3314 stop:3919 length:606 start_codon:yes stop_codon:yes gene_type:complete